VELELVVRDVEVSPGQGVREGSDDLVLVLARVRDEDVEGPVVCTGLVSQRVRDLGELRATLANRRKRSQ
jgi:hypothetical protein